MTEKQADLLAWIRDFIADHGFSPSYEEMRVAMGAPSKSDVFRMVGALEAQGKVRRLPGRSRTIEVLGLGNIQTQRPAAVIAKSIMRALEAAGGLADIGEDELYVVVSQQELRGIIVKGVTG